MSCFSFLLLLASAMASHNTRPVCGPYQPQGANDMYCFLPGPDTPFCANGGCDRGGVVVLGQAQTIPNPHMNISYECMITKEKSLITWLPMSPFASGGWSFCDEVPQSVYALGSAAGPNPQREEGTPPLKRPESVAECRAQGANEAAYLESIKNMDQEAYLAPCPRPHPNKMYYAEKVGTGYVPSETPTDTGATGYTLEAFNAYEGQTCGEWCNLYTYV